MSGHGNELSHLLKCLTVQLVRRNRPLSAYIHKEYIERGLSPSVARLKTLIARLSSATRELRICIDGVDECAEKDQTQIISAILPLVQQSASNTLCKVLFATRDTRPLARHLAKFATISLTEERSLIDPAIKGLVQASLPSLSRQIGDDSPQNDLIARIEHDLVTKAEGTKKSKISYRSF